MFGVEELVTRSKGLWATSETKREHSPDKLRSEKNRHFHPNATLALRPVSEIMLAHFAAG
jgi:hypothetical protein